MKKTWAKGISAAVRSDGGFTDCVCGERGVESKGSRRRPGRRRPPAGTQAAGERGDRSAGAGRRVGEITFAWWGGDSATRRRRRPWRRL